LDKLSVQKIRSRTKTGYFLEMPNFEWLTEREEKIYVLSNPAPAEWSEVGY